MNDNVLTLNGNEVRINGEKNLLELIRTAGIELPTFCYHSELSVYGACRLCIVDIEGRGITASCSVSPQAGMKIKTHTSELRAIRKMNIELLLASHDQACATCGKSLDCSLLGLARKLGVESVRFKRAIRSMQIDSGNPSIVRDPNKCILCGDCVRVCSEIQGIGAIDFAHRGSKATVGPAFGKNLSEVECVMCGQCAKVCPTGAITLKSSVNDVWKKLNSPDLKVFAQIAPAVRVSIGEHFGMKPGEDASGKLASALKRIGFHAVYDTAYSADLVAIEEAAEYFERREKGGALPIITSCCPAWVSYCEQFHPELIPHLSTCRSPQQALGAILKEKLSSKFGVTRDKICVVSIMPCSAKKAEAERPENADDTGTPDVDIVIGVGELAAMIQEAGLDFYNLEPSAMDMPFGFKTGAGLIFGGSGGVAEAVLRLAKPDSDISLAESAGGDGTKIIETEIEKDKFIRIAVVSGLANAGALAKKIADENGAGLDIVEVMACPGGCVNGAAQPARSRKGSVEKRNMGLRRTDMGMELRNSSENPFAAEWIENKSAHRLLHTTYHAKRRIEDESMEILNAPKESKIADVTVCVGTGCFLRGSRKVIAAIADKTTEKDWNGRVSLKATFCHEICDRGPSVTINGRQYERCDAGKAIALINKVLEIHAPASAE